MHGFTRSMRPLIVGALLVGAAATGASAQLVPFQGTTQACFFNSPATTCTPSTNTPPITSAFFLANINNPGMTVTNGHNTLFFTNQNFAFTTTNPGTHTFQIGAFSFNATNPVQTLTNQFFVLSVLLTQPGANNPMYQATVTGKLQGFQAQNGTGGITVSFNPSTQGPYAFNGGRFTLAVNGGTYFSDALNQPLYATATVTPEPVTMTLFGTGLGGLALLRRRRKKNADRTNA